jgi:hypothetical protein
MEAGPLHLKEANEFVAQHHRHNSPTVGYRFALGVSVDGKLVGVAIAGRPICRRLDDGKTLEILRVATDSRLPQVNRWQSCRKPDSGWLALGMTRWVMNHSSSWPLPSGPC